MRRTSGPDHVPNLFGAGKHGYTNGDPGVSPATATDAACVNAIQEEIARTIEGAGLTLNPADNTQLLQAINQRIADAGAPTGDPNDGLYYAVARSALANYRAGTVPTNFAPMTMCAMSAGGENFVVAGGEVVGTGIAIVITVGPSGLSQSPAAGSPAASQFLGSAWNGTTVALVGGNNSTSIIQTSATGTTWTMRLNIASAGRLLGCCVHTGGNFVAVGSGAQVYRSTSGVSWTPGIALSGAHLHGVDSNGIRLVAVGINAAGTAPVIQTSDDGGVTWVSRSPAPTSSIGFTSVAWTGVVWIAVGALGEIQISPDGTTWTQVSNDGFSGFLRAITRASNNAMLIVGDAGEIQTGRIDGTGWTRVSKMTNDIPASSSSTAILYSATQSPEMHRAFFGGATSRLYYTNQW